MPSNLSYFNELLGGVPTPPDDYRPGVDPEFNYFPPAPAPAPAPAPPGPIGSGIGSGIGHGVGQDPQLAAEKPSVHQLSDPNLGGSLTNFGVGLAVPGVGQIGTVAMGALELGKALGQSYGVVGGVNNPQVGTPQFRDHVNAGQKGRDLSRGERNIESGGASSGGPGPSGGAPEGTPGHFHQGGIVQRGAYHQGGEISDKDPDTYRENIEINAQEGEFVVSRPAVEAYGMKFFQALNDVAQNGPSEQNLKPIRATLQQIMQGMKQAAMSQQPMPQPASKTGLQRFAGMAR